MICETQFRQNVKAKVMIYRKKEMISETEVIETTTDQRLHAEGLRKCNLRKSWEFIYLVKSKGSERRLACLI